MKRVVKTKTATVPFTVKIDTREQLPYLFQHIKPIVPTEFGTLQSGDYSIVGMENRIAIERKSVNDFYGSITRGRRHLEAEFQRMEQMNFSAIIVEGQLKSIFDPILYGRKVTPQAIRATIAAWSIKYKTRWFFVPSRAMGEQMTFELLEKFYRFITKKATPRNW